MVVRAGSQIDIIWGWRTAFIGIGIAGVIAAPLASVYPGMGDQMLIMSFVVIVLGGMGSLSGTLIAALLLYHLTCDPNGDCADPVLAVYKINLAEVTAGKGLTEMEKVWPK